MTALREEAISLLANALQVDASLVDDNTALGVTPQWDSLAHMRLILILEERLGRQLGPESIVAITGLGDIITVLESEI